MCFWIWTALCLALMAGRKAKDSISIIRHMDIMLAYNLFNWFRRLVLPADMRKQQVDTIRLKLIKIAARAIHSARSITFKLCSSCPYKKEFYRTLKNIQQLSVQLE